MIDFSCQFKILLLNMLKLFFIPDFLLTFVQNFRFFLVLSLKFIFFLGFFRFPCKVATLVFFTLYINIIFKFRSTNIW